ncbi:hypothetical protein [Cobetia sp. 5-11-6-3]|uniref:hypothetical protein n=1 Tax=Cobetia sp. 5-11-6-3 TaxID=2737458 RepID=UPI001596422E|nr:hypothetical protein [Cobetia sp. 5-11-6-3]
MIELISSNMEGLLYRFSADTITGIFCWAILAIGIAALICYRKDKMRSLTHYTTNLLTSLGMLGTFIGIVIGLLHFDTADIEGSISLLLDGLKTAFMTSLFGMALAMVYKVLTGLEFMQPKSEVATGPKEVGPEHIHQVMLQQNEQLAQQTANLEKLHLAIAGDDSDTLTGQIRLLRQNQDDNHKALVREVDRQSTAAEALGIHADAQRQRFDAFARELSEQMREFAEMMSKSATEQVINALKEVIQDFNNQLTEQFGDNFKALDASVKSLVEWQENYRQQLGEMRDQYAQGVTAITDTEKSVANISTSASAIPETMSGLGTLLTATQRQLADLEAHLAVFADMRDKAIEAVPQINAQVEKTVADISQAAFNAATQLVSGSEELKKELVDGTAKINAEMIEGASGLNERYNSVHQSLQGTSDHLAAQATEIAGQFRDAHETVNTQVRTMIEHLQQQHEVMGKNITEGNERIAEQLSDSSARMNETHRKGIEIAEQQVTSLSDKLGEYSTQLTRQLGEAGETNQKQLRETLENGLKQYQGQLTAAQEQLQGALKKVSEDTQTSLNGQFETLNKETQEQLLKVMNEMGSALTTITKGFTNDYGRLTNEMHRIIQQADKAGAF